MDSILATQPYPTTGHGVIFLPPHIQWSVFPKYVGEHDGQTTIDERVTLVLQDTPQQFWPVIVKMSLPEAEQLCAQLAATITERRRLDSRDQ